jgi:hypothetical protein
MANMAEAKDDINGTWLPVAEREVDATKSTRRRLPQITTTLPQLCRRITIVAIYYTGMYQLRQ